MDAVSPQLTTIKKSVKHGVPSLSSNRPGLYALFTIGKQRVVLMKSDLHPSTDGTALSIRSLWAQAVAEVKPSLVITTGTAGGVGADTLLGDVIVAKTVRWDCTKTFASETWAHATYTDPHPPRGNLDPVHFGHRHADPGQQRALPAAARPPVIATGAQVLTTDFFAFDTSADTYGLRAHDPDARAVEMDDAALALALSTLADPPAWVSVRNASDPQIPSTGTLKDQANEAAKIYEKYGYWTTVNSAITTWALIAG